jgi:lipopolysaccharide/colanic/teichoic acid biosynthesis glycosyltransferase
MKTSVIKKCLIGATSLVATVALGCKFLNTSEERGSTYKSDYTREISPEATVYERYVKRGLDVLISGTALVAMSPIMAYSAIKIFKEDPGNFIFSQKRVGTNKTYFSIHKFRSMKKNTPDLPTHLLENPEQYILKVGKFLRSSSCDELPQLIDILRGRMSVVGPRPALWTQDDLIEERDKYNANSVKPGLTGWAQINGRDELEINVKARLDGEYTKALRKSNISGFLMDCKCFFGTFLSVLRSEGVREGGPEK